MSRPQTTHPIGAACKGAIVGAFLGGVISFAVLKLTASPEFAECLAAASAGLAVAIFASRASLYETGKGLPISFPVVIATIAGTMAALVPFWLGVISHAWLLYMIPGTVSGGAAGLIGALFQRHSAIPVQRESCPVCQNEIQGIALHCPHCGHDHSN